MIVKYSELSEELKEEAQKWRPDDYQEWSYNIQGVEIAWACQ